MFGHEDGFIFKDLFYLFGIQSDTERNRSRARERERRRERKIYHPLVTPQIATIVGVRPDQVNSKKLLGLHPALLHGWQRPRNMGHLPLLSLVY